MHYSRSGPRQGSTCFIIQGPQYLGEKCYCTHFTVGRTINSLHVVYYNLNSLLQIFCSSIML